MPFAFRLSNLSFYFRPLPPHCALGYAASVGACAAAVVGQLQGKLDTHCRIELPGGELRFFWQPGQSVRMSGSAEFVFDGQIQV